MKKYSLLAAILAFAFVVMAEAQEPRSFRCPPYLHRGDTVAIVSPAAKLRRKKIEKTFAMIESWGLHVKLEPNYAIDTCVYFAGSDRDRASDFQAALDDPSVKAIIACQGGYGSVRILPMLDFENFKRNPKWVVGFSDITMLHLAVRKMEIQSIHGTMPSQFETHPDSLDLSAESLRKALFGEVKEYVCEPHPMNRKGKAAGILAGGNMIILTSAAGTPEAVNGEQPSVLFVEETNESAYRLDRMMQQLLRSGALDNVTAIVGGHFTGIYNENRFIEHGAILREYADKLGIPLMLGLPAGHDKPNMSLYMGRCVEVEVTDTSATLRFKE